MTSRIRSYVPRRYGTIKEAVTELIEAFSLGFALFLPFLVLDLLVANVLMALGLLMTNPTQVSLPFKLLLFVAADGWGLLAESLVTGYR